MPANLSLAELLDAGHVRLTELAVALRAARELEDAHTTERLVESILHLRLFLEEAARLPEGSTQQEAILSYLLEAYGLRQALLDPLLRPLLPAIPATGATLIRRVLMVNGKLLLLNGKLLILGARLSTP